MSHKLSFGMVWRALSGVVFAMTPLLSMPLLYAGEEEAVTELLQRWSSMSSSIATANLHYRHLVILGKRGEDLSEAAAPALPDRDGFNRFLHETIVPLIGAVDSEVQMSAASDRFLTPANNAVYASWQDLRIIEDGTSLRNDSLIKWELKDADPEYKPYVGSRFGPKEHAVSSRVRTKDGEQSLNGYGYGAVRDVPSQIVMYRIQNFRFTRVSAPAAGQPPFSMELTAAGRATLSSGLQLVEYDPVTAFINHFKQTSRSGEVYREVWQFRPVDCGGMLMPTVLARAEYSRVSKGGLNSVLLRRADVYVLIDAEVNREIDQSSFRLAAKKGTVISRAFREPSFPPAIRLTEDVSDISHVNYPLRADSPLNGNDDAKP